jgi:glycine oxidase
MLAPIAEAAYGEERLLGLARASLERYPAFVAELEKATGADVALRTSGTLQVGFDADDMRALDELHAFHLKLGLPAERLTSREARAAEPSLTTRVRGGVRIPSDHSVDARALRDALAVAATKAGATLVSDTVTALTATGLQTATTAIEADVVVLAMGAWSATLPGVPPLPVRPVKGQILRLGRAQNLITGTVRALVRGRQVYLVPLRDDQLIIGATVEEQGFDGAATAGGVYELLRDAIEVVPGVTELELAETVVRFRPGTPDNAPILGGSGTENLILATGHYRNGVLLAPVTGEAIAEQILTGALPDEAKGFGVERFGDRP